MARAPVGSPAGALGGEAALGGARAPVAGYASGKHMQNEQNEKRQRDTGPRDEADQERPQLDPRDLEFRSPGYECRLSPHSGTIVDATIIAATSSAKNAGADRDRRCSGPARARN